MRKLKVLAPFLLLAASACASERGSVYTHPNADFSNYERVAVLPLENLSADRFASERVREILAVELSAQGLFDVVEIGEVNRQLRVQDLGNVTELGAAQIAQLGAGLSAQGLILGSVIEFRERRSGSILAPDISLSLRMIDVETGLTVWTASHSRSGADVAARMFGMGEESQSEAVRELIRQLIDTL